MYKIDDEKLLSQTNTLSMVSIIAIGKLKSFMKIKLKL